MEIYPVFFKKCFVFVKILVINPPGPGNIAYNREGRCMHKIDLWISVLPPVSLVLLGTILKNLGHHLDVIDSAAERLTVKELENRMSASKYDLVFINTGTPTIESDLYVAAIAKKANPEAKTAAFGIHPSVLPEKTFGLNSSLDFIIRGEPEETANRLALAVSKGESPENIPGISYRKGDKIMHNPDRGFIENLDELPIPDWSLVPYRKYIMPIRFRPYFYVITSRGCPYSCTFCAQKKYYGEGVRLRSPEKIVDEIKFLKANYGISDFMMWADTFTINREHTMEICERLIHDGIKIHWTTTTRADLVDEEMLKAMKKAGCWLVVHGIESGDQNILDAIKKGTTVSKIEETVYLEKRLGLKVIGHFIIGFPDDTKKTVEKTIEFALNLPVDFAQFYFAVPFPGSELFETCKERGLIEIGNWSKFEQDSSVIKNQNLTPEELNRLRIYAYRRFYLRPGVIWNNLGILKNPHGLGYMFKNGGMFFRSLLGLA